MSQKSSRTNSPLPVHRWLPYIQPVWEQQQQTMYCTLIPHKPIRRHTHTWNDTSRRMFITPWTPQPSMCCAVGVVIINYNTYCNYVETGSWTWMGQRASDAMTKFFLQKLLWARKLSCDFWLSNVNLKLLPPAPAIVQRHHIIFEGVANGIYSNAVHYADLCM